MGRKCSPGGIAKEEKKGSGGGNPDETIMRSYRYTFTTVRMKVPQTTRFLF